MAQNTPYITVVSPVYRGEEMVDELVERTASALRQITDKFEIILVEDCGPDNSWQKIYENCQKYPYVKGIKLSRNFGQHYAITAGLEASSGEWVVVMDCDLQDVPEEIPNLHKKALEGFDLVVAQRFNRQDSFLKKYFSKMFYKTFSYLTASKQDSSVANFGIYQRKVIDAVLNMHDAVRAFPILVQWVGFNRAQIPVYHAERASGKSSYNFYRLFKLAFDIIISFSTRPLKIVLQFGVFISIISLVIGGIYFSMYLTGQITVPGYTSLVLSIWFLSGVIIATLGIIGLYIGKIFDQVKNRPLYIINKSINFSQNDELP